MNAKTSATRIAAAVVGVIVVAFIVLLATRGSQSSKQISGRMLGREVPPVAGETMQGGTFDIAELRGSWVVVNFFAEWCVPCRVEHPELVKFAAEHSAAGDVRVVSVVFQDDVKRVREFFDTNGGDWPVIVGDTGRMALDFGVTGVPESYVVNPEGIIVAKFEGVTASGLDEAIARTGGA